ncbi:hypothetical protein FB567DRAFT_78704 [Paraphoma chrysanthemicola]|uniref:F-box domain-containing protein n=1 Tax=Paraphoma chrysanthemicola TaxID=798071 RepID=A0A8K0R3D5_9PLEO|nr:hypothetical protein FB567DRAFT_78704 [Paraphoma chrysanthemicola]
MSKINSSRMSSRKLWFGTSAIVGRLSGAIISAFTTRSLHLDTSSGLLNLPAEMLVIIMSHMTRTDLKSLCETCRSLQEIATAELYHTVDLSSHNATSTSKSRETYQMSYPSAHHVPLDFLKREWTSLDHETFQRQRQFINSMAISPAHGKHVRRLHWTILDVNSRTWRWRGSGEDDWDLDARGALYEPEDEPLWTAFKRCTNISHVDICWIRPWREVTLPPPLFPSARSVRLSGCMTRAFVSRVLEPSSQNLEHLALVNLLRWSDGAQSLPQFDHISALNDYLYENNAEEELEPPSRLMLGALDFLIGRSSLTTLCIGTLGDKSRNGDADPRYDELYSSWSRILNDSRCTLQRFCFDQGVEIYGHGRPQRTVHKQREADRLFSKWILPVLLDSPWPLLRRLQLKGVQSLIHEGQFIQLDNAETQLPQIDLEISELLSKTLPEGASISVDAWASREYEQIYYEDMGVPF